MVTPNSGEEIKLKAGGYADDVFVLCGADEDSVMGKFTFKE